MYLHPVASNEVEDFRNEFVDKAAHKPIELYGKISNVNLMVGANNSRKSRFLRHLIITKSFVQHSFDVIDFKKRFSDCVSRLEKVISNDKMLNGGALNSHINKRAMETDRAKYEKALNLLDNVKNATALRRILGRDIISYLTHLNSKIDHKIVTSEQDKAEFISIGALLKLICFWLDSPSDQDFFYYSSNTHIWDARKKYMPILSNLKTINRLLDEFIETSSVSIGPKKIYVPIPRGALTLHNTGDSVYRDTITQRHPQISKSGISIHTGQDLYNVISSNKSDNMTVRDRIKSFEKFIGMQFYNAKEVELTARTDGDNREQRILHINIDGTERAIHNIGDGIHTIITLLHPVFMADDKTWIFIEEPENHLHPGFQSLFINTITHHPEIKNKNLRFFITTHSNHILDAGIESPNETSVFSFENYNKKSSIIRQEVDFKLELLDMLGVYNSSVFMSNCSIWIEGITDRRIIQAYLTAYQKHHDDAKHFIEGFNYSFFEFSGSNLSHYAFDESDEDNSQIFAPFLSNRIFLLHDYDGKRKQKLHENLGRISELNERFEYAHTGVVEIENTLDSSILFDSLRDIGIKIPLGKSLSNNKYKTTRLGEILRKEFKVKLSMIADSGTLKTSYKIKLSSILLRKVKDGDITWEQISQHPDAKRITESIYQFIKKMNK